MVDKVEATGCLGIFLKLIGNAPSGGAQSRGIGIAPSGADPNGTDLPYRLTKKFLSPAELGFHRVLEQAVGTTHSINNKVRLWDILYVPRSEESRKYENKISSKHIDFLLCDPTTMHPVLAIELDDASHHRTDRQGRDNFIDKALAAAGLPILHVKAARSYSIVEIRQQVDAALAGPTAGKQLSPPLPPLPTGPARSSTADPSCPHCHSTMIQRKAGKGKHAGKRFWACTNYPQCREIIGID